MSKWIGKDVFSKFKNELKEESEKQEGQGTDFSILWQKPVKGTQKKPEKYVVRLLPDKNSNFWKSYHFHFFKVEDKWKFFICPKTFNQDEYCPICSVVSKLYKGTDEDKKTASQLKRKEQFITNVYIVDDPRDVDRDDDKKVSGTVKLYEFSKVLKNLIQEGLLDSDNGIGEAGYDPGDNGYDFIIKIGAKDKDAAGQEWPDYSLSAFARKPSSIADSDEEIEKIMEQTHDLDEYLNSRRSSESKMIEALKEALVYGLIKEEYEKRVDKKESSEEVEADEKPSKKASKVDEDEDNEPEQEEKPIKQKPKPQPVDEDDDDELLKELKDIV